MPLSNAQQFPLWINVAIFAAAGVVVWFAGTRLTHYLDGIAARTRLGHVFVGMLLLGGITSLPEVANSATSAAVGDPRLGINNLLGSAAINVLLLAVGDALIGRDAVTSAIVKPSTIMMGTLCMLLLMTVAGVVTTGDRLVGGVGAGALGICVLCIAFLWIAAGYDRRAPWMVQGEREEGRDEVRVPDLPLRQLVVRSAVAGVVIFAAGYALSQTGDAIAGQTGLGAGMVGFVLIGVATSMPELSTVLAALRIRRYEMAFGQVLGTNFVNLTLILLSDAVFSGGPVMNELGPFEVVSALLGAMLIGIFMVGLLEHRNPRVLRMGYDSLAVMILFACGVAVLATLR